MSVIEIDTITAPRRSPAVTTASLLYLVIGLGTAASEVPSIAYMAQNRAFPVVFGIPLMGSWFAERLGFDFTIRAAGVFTVVSALEVLAGYWLWKSDKRGGKLALALLPFTVFFWILFEIPAGIILGPARLAALAAAWKSLR
jgi:hypothetical protein